jgi:hypothetical protein
MSSITLSFLDAMPQNAKFQDPTPNYLLHKTSNYVIPAKAGIQYYQTLPGFRFSPERRIRELCKVLGLTMCRSAAI